MIRISRKRLQADVDAGADYPARVALAKRRFKSRNVPRNATFRVVRETLARMCQGPRRCMYCEDSVADEVEHFRPKDLYPEVVFAWSNYLYSCGPCNGPKNNQFLVLTRPGEAVVNVTRPRRSAIVPPVAGRPVILDPTRDNPLDFLMLDLRDTFEFSEIATPGSFEFERARWTIQILGLNRDFLVAARENAYSGYRARVQEYIDRRDGGGSAADLRGLRAALLRSPHPTVWAEMQRQHAQIAELTPLFAQAPEAIHW
jgi:uncharacterized protein (TIGR02646 family)